MKTNQKKMQAAPFMSAALSSPKMVIPQGSSCLQALKNYFVYILALCLFPAVVSAQFNPIPVHMDTMALKNLEKSIPKQACVGGCPTDKTCHDGCCIYPLGRPASGNWNYLIYNDNKPMKDLKLSFKVTREMEAEYDQTTTNCAQIPKSTDPKFTTQGVVVQFNCFSKDADKQQNKGGMVQYIFYVSGQKISPHIQYVSGTPDGKDHDWLWQGGNYFPDITLPKANTLPAGYTLEVEFGTDDNGYVNDVTFRVTDDKGKSHDLKAPKPGQVVAQATAVRPGTLYPLRISEFQTNVVSTNGRCVHFKAGGEGTLTYSSKDKLCVEGGSYEHATGTDLETCESSNAIYGFLSSCCSEAGKSFSQSVKVN